MKPLSLQKVLCYVDESILDFHQKSMDCLDEINLSEILQRKNIFLLNARCLRTISETVKVLLDEELLIKQETIFGDWLEGLAIFINNTVYGGWKSGITGIDLEFDCNGIRNIVTIKSGPNWGNSSQIAKMRTDFNTAKKTLRTSNSQLQIKAVNGCCYGRDNNPDKGDYFKYCGQRFWEFISGNKDLYLDIIEPLGHTAREKNDAFIESYSRMINKFTKDFANSFCKTNGDIDWGELLRFNSGTENIRTQSPSLKKKLQSAPCTPNKS